MRSSIVHKSRLALVILLATFVLEGCQKKYVCVCSGYGGVKSTRKFKFHTETDTGAMQYCASLATSTTTCALEE